MKRHDAEQDTVPNLHIPMLEDRLGGAFKAVEKY